MSVSRGQAMSRSLIDRINELADAFSGSVGIAATNLATGERVEYQAKLVLPTASVIKVPILVTLLRQAECRRVDLESRLTLDEGTQVGGSGVLKLFQPGLEPTILDAATLMIALSDNTATNMVLDVTGGLEPVNETISDLGLRSCVIHNAIDFDVIGPDVRRLGESSAGDLCDLMYLIATRRAISEGVSEQAEEILSTQQYFDQGLRYILANPYARELGVTSPVSVAAKTGFFTGTRVDAGIVRFSHGGGFVYAFANHESADASFLAESEGAVLNGLIGRALLQHWWDSDDAPPPVARTAYEQGCSKSSSP